MDILFALQQYNGLTVAELVDHVQLPRSTIVRMLETLAEMGYVAQSMADRKYRPIAKTEELARGFEADRRLAAAVEEPLAAFVQQEGWTIAIATLHGLTMVVEYVATPPLAIDSRRLIVGMRTPLLDTAAGLVALSYAPLEHLPKLLAAAEADALAQRSSTSYVTDEVEPILRRVREVGYAVHTTHDATYIAVPLLLSDGQVRAVSIRLCSVKHLPQSETRALTVKLTGVAHRIRSAFVASANVPCSQTGDPGA